MVGRHTVGLKAGEGRERCVREAGKGREEGELHGEGREGKGRRNGGGIVGREGGI